MSGYVNGLYHSCEPTQGYARYKTIRSIMQTIADKCNGSMAIQAEVHAREMKEQYLENKLHNKDLEIMIEVLKERIKNAVADEKAKAVFLAQFTKDKAKVGMVTTVDK